MPETFGIPDPEPTREERIIPVANEFVAGRSIVRTVVLYALAALLAVSPIAPAAVIPLILLLASDPRMA